MTGYFAFDYSTFLKEIVRIFPVIKTIYDNTQIKCLIFQYFSPSGWLCASSHIFL